MMFPGKFFAALLAIAASGVTGSPVELEKRDLGVIYMCQGKNWGQPCLPIHVPDKGCQKVPDDYDKKINSIGSVETLYCALFA
jgi:hypothetical protein